MSRPEASNPHRQSGPAGPGGFTHLDVAYLTSIIHHGNEASVRVARRLGFTPLREDVLGERPVTVYGLTRAAYAVR